jgi:short-subunit dehydrogenase
MTHAQFEESLAVNFWGTVNATFAVLPGMRERGRGRIVNITSIGGIVAVPHLLPYTAAKFAAVGFSEGLAAELAAEGITVTTIVPGLMRTGSFLHAWFQGRHEHEFMWFSLGSALPLVSMDAQRAARQIIAAMRRRETERVLSLPAKVLARVHGVVPGVTVRVMALINRMLPRADGARPSAEPGWQVDRRHGSPMLHAATFLGHRAARRFNQRA